jgi:hypothetical protein
MKGGHLMQTQQAIIQQYIAADEEERLTMFLSYRDCRRQFIKIDMEALKVAKAQKTAAQAAPQRRSRHMNFHNVCLGWLKRCWATR